MRRSAAHALALLLGEDDTRSYIQQDNKTTGALLRQQITMVFLEQLRNAQLDPAKASRAGMSEATVDKYERRHKSIAEETACTTFEDKQELDSDSSSLARVRELEADMQHDVMREFLLLK